jgi:hypothetical protein
MDLDIFGDGIDFHSLKYFWKTGRSLNVQNYVFNITRFAHFMANFKFPVIIGTGGILRNAAISVFLNQPMVGYRSKVIGCKSQTFSNSRSQ